ncbi:hypothetical protein AB0H36_37500 [Kribbella sp. NPDC050820]|uniref:hypothetical protein n=1 Tax=Kribbella sp. NPDC050820 TaxID=3155408 RepID=UPI0033CEBC17
MRTLTTAWKTLRDHLSGYSPRPELVCGGFASTPPALPGAPLAFGAGDVPIGLDYYGNLVHLPPGHVLISGDRKTGVTTTVRGLAIHAAKYPGARLHVYDSTGEWAAMRLLADRFVTRAHGIADGLSDDTAAAQVLADLDALHREMQRRNDHLQALNADLAAAGATRQVTSVADATALPPSALKAAGIDPARTDTETAGLHRHVVVIPNLDWWLTHDPHGTGRDIGDKLFWLAGRGESVGIHLAAAVTARRLPDVSPALVQRLRTRIVLRIANHTHGERVIPSFGHAEAFAAAETAHDRFPMLAWIATPDDGGTLLRRVQLYRTDPMRLHRALGWCHNDRGRRGWLTGDALAVWEETQAWHAAQRASGTASDTSDGEGRR